MRHREQAGLVVELLGYVFADALNRLATAASGVVRFVANIAATGVSRRLQLAPRRAHGFGARLVRNIKVV